MGRWIGEALALSHYFHNITVGGYAIVGAAAMAAGMKRFSEITFLCTT